MMTHTPRVSIGLAVYNGERFLKQTLDSIVAQTFEDFELVVSDNASSDSTEEICKGYAARDSRIKYSRNSVNIGANHNFNRAFQLSSGQYFRWSAADDLFEPTSLEVCVNVLDEHPEVALCYPKTVLIDAHGNKLRSYEDNLDLRSSRAAERFRLALLNMGLLNAHYGLIRSDVLRRTPLYGTYPGADMVLLAELTLYGQFWEIPQQLFFRRMHDAASSALKREDWDTLQAFCDPATTGELNLYHWTHRLYNIASIFRAPVGAAERLHLTCILGRYAFRGRDVYFKELVSAGAQLIRRSYTTNAYDENN
jgi:glycosyltransferase involved in cell wall biosynthesis